MASSCHSISEEATVAVTIYCNVSGVNINGHYCLFLLASLRKTNESFVYSHVQGITIQSLLMCLTAHTESAWNG